LASALVISLSPQIIEQKISDHQIVVPLCGLEDSNSNEFLDLVCHFHHDASNWSLSSDGATLTGTLLDGTEIEETDTPCVVL